MIWNIPLAQPQPTSLWGRGIGATSLVLFQHCLATVKKYGCVTSTILTTDRKHSAIGAAVGKVYCTRTPARPSTETLS